MTAPARRNLQDILIRMPASRQRRHVTLVAAVASVLGSLPLAMVFERWTWWIQSSLVVAGLCAAALLVRGLRGPAWASTLAMIGLLPVLLGWLFPSHEEFLGFLPSPATLRHFGDLASTAVVDMQHTGAPVEDRQGFLFLAALGVGGIAIMVDLLAVVLHRPAMAGLPMLAVYSVPVAVRDGSVNIVPFALGVLGFLWLLVVDNLDRVRRFGRRFSGEGRDIELWEPSPLTAAGQRLGLIGIVLAIALPLFIPGVNSGLLSQMGVGNGTGGGGGPGGGGSGGRVSLYAMLSGNLRRDRAFDMVRVTTNDRNPYYLRFAVADQLSADGFSTREPTKGQPVASGLPGPQPATAGVTQRSYKATVEILDLDIQYLPLYTMPTSITGVGKSWRYDPTTSVIYSTKQTTRATRKYNFEYVRSNPTADALRTAPPLNESDTVQRDFTYVPTNSAVEARVRQLTTGKRTPYDKVMAIFNFFSPRNGFTYSRSTGEKTSATKIMDFLNRKQGFCVQYSAAMAWLVRQAKIPARVVFGFTRGRDKPGKPTVLTSFNLHAWTEVYFSGYGWIPFDPTPATAVSGSVSPAWAPNPARPSDASTEDPGAGPGDQGSQEPSASASPFPGENGDENSATGGGKGPARHLLGWPFWLLLGGAAVVVALAMPGWRRAALRRRRLRPRGLPGPARGPSTGPSPGAPAAGLAGYGGDADAEALAGRAARAAWDELLDTMTDFRIAVDDTETPRMTVQRLASLGMSDAAMGGLQVLGRVVEHARYARRPIASAELESCLTTVRSTLAARVSRRTRFQAYLLPPSILRRWRAGLDRTTGRIVTAVVVRWDVLVRALHYRRFLGPRRVPARRPSR